MEIFSEKIISKRRNNLKTKWESLLGDEDCVLIACGEPQGKPGGLDQTYNFLPHPSYFWLTGYRRPHSITAFSKKTGFVDFIKPVSVEERFWEGSRVENFPGSKDLNELKNFVSKFKSVTCLGQSSQDLKGLEKLDSVEKAKIQLAMDQVRRIKDDAEIEYIVEAARIANKGYEKIKKMLRAGITERQLQIEYEAEVQRHGAHTLPYDTIIGAGINAAILHAVPTNRKIKKSDVVLVDAGVDIYNYCVDITRTYPASGKFSSKQQEVYDFVLESQTSAIKMSKAGTEWRDVHYESARVIAEGLKQLKILKGETTSILESGAVSVFYPHGVGHLVGLRVRDTGTEENTNPKKYCGARLRVDMKIQEGHVLTVEPGCYFIEALIENPEVRKQYKDFINWTEVEKWKDFGGVRLEDDILITKTAPRNLTRIVKK